MTPQRGFRPCGKRSLRVTISYSPLSARSSGVSPCFLAGAHLNLSRASSHLAQSHLNQPPRRCWTALPLSLTRTCSC
jgi:hypothetical protein